MRAFVENGGKAGGVPFMERLGKRGGRPTAGRRNLGSDQYVRLFLPA